MKLNKYPCNGSYWRVEMSGTVEEIDTYLIRLYNMGATDATFERKDLDTFHVLNLDQKRWEDALTNWLMIQNADQNQNRELCRKIQRARREKIPVYSQLMRRIAQEEIAAIPIPEIKKAPYANRNHNYNGIEYISGTNHEAEMMERSVEIPHKFNCARGANVSNFSCHATAEE